MADVSLELAAQDLEPLVQRRRVLLIGEPPGTEEFPALVLELARQGLASGHEVIVGLEVPMTEEVERGPVGPFWQRAAEFQDGRSSRAMASLVEELALMRRNGDKVETVAMDGPWVAPGSTLPLEHMGLLETPRDELMATNLLAVMDRTPRAFTIVMAGAMHTTLHAEAWRTLGSILGPWFPTLTALYGQLTGGTRWLLPADASEGAVFDVPHLELPAGALWADEVGADGHHGYLNIGHVTASPPHASA